jgi:preprotein translocase subunit YajC
VPTPNWPVVELPADFFDRLIDNGETNVSFISNAFAQGTATGGIESNLMSFLPLILMFGVLYFIMIRPQMKRQKEHRNMLSAMAKGDEVVTNGGIVGKVTKVGEAYVGVEISEGTEITVQKASVTTILPKGTIKSL